MIPQSRRPVLEFIISAYVLSWAVVLCLALAGGKWNTPPAFAAASLYMFGPLCGALIALRGAGRRAIRERLGLSFRINRWYFVAWLLPFALSGLVFAFSLAMPGAEFSRNMDGMFERLARTLPPDKIRELRDSMAALPLDPFILGIIQALVAGFTVNALFALGEEAGWRGFLLGQWGAKGFWRCSLAIGLVWGAWHAPLILMGHNYPEHPVAGVFMMVGVCLLLSPLFSYVRLKSGSVIAAAVIHGTFNAVAGLSVMFVKGGGDLTVGATGLAGLLALAAMNALVFLFDRFVSGGPVMR